MFKELHLKLNSLQAYLSRELDVRMLILVTLAAVVLCAMMIVKDKSENRYLIGDEEGNLTAIEDPEGEGRSYSLRVEAEREGETAARDITLTMKGKEEKSENAAGDNLENKDDLRDELDSLAGELAGSHERRILLPPALEDGTRLKWTRPGKRGDVVLILLIPVLYLVLSVVQGKQKDKERREERRSDILSSLPAFNNQLLVLLGCGMIFPDAYAQIAASYGQYQGKSYFAEMIRDIYDRSLREKRSIVEVLGERAEGEGIRELSRIVELIKENQYLGTDLSEKLRAESGELWERRKKIALEKGKKAETGMTFPLAMLLMVLIIVTAAPALLEVKGG